MSVARAAPVANIKEGGRAGVPRENTGRGEGGGIYIYTYIYVHPVFRDTKHIGRLSLQRGQTAAQSKQFARLIDFPWHPRFGVTGSTQSAAACALPLPLLLLLLPRGDKRVIEHRPDRIQPGQIDHRPVRL